MSPHYSPVLLMLQTALCYAASGQPDRALSIFQWELWPAEFSLRDYGYFQALMAGVLADLGEPDEAATGDEHVFRVTSTLHRPAPGPATGSTTSSHEDTNESPRPRRTKGLAGSLSHRSATTRPPNQMFAPQGMTTVWVAWDAGGVQRRHGSSPSQRRRSAGPPPYVPTSRRT